MKTFTLQLALLLAFAVGVGDFAFRTWYPPLAPDYMIAAQVRPLTLTQAENVEPAKHLYMRKSWHLTRTPEQAWIQLLGHDLLEVHVNGRLVGRTERTSARAMAALVTDITPFLHVGKNSIAIHVAQGMLDRAPAVAIQGDYEFADGSKMSLDDPADWRATDVYDRRGAFWYETEFNDDHWKKPLVGEVVAWRGRVELPPRAVTESRRSAWVRPAESKDGAAVFSRSFEVPGGARDGWLRVLATGPYCLAVNGEIVADDRLSLALGAPYQPLEQTFDISSLLRSGQNTVAVAVSTAGEAPRLRLDCEANTRHGEHVYVATDGEWHSLAGNVADWHLLQPAGNADFQPCQAELGYLGVVPRRIFRELAETNPAPSFWISRSAAYLGIVGMFGFFGWLGCIATARTLRSVTAQSNDDAHGILPYVALVPGAAAAGVGWLCAWDVSWSMSAVYRPLWLSAIVLLVVMQWLLLVVIAPRVAAQRKLPSSIDWSGARWQRYGFAACWLVIVGVALWLRVRDIRAEPIHHDEIGAYAFTQGVLEYGVPAGQVDPDLPFGYCSTSELAYYPTALCALFVDDPELVLRIPAVFWSMATLLLVGFMGTRWFNKYVGLAAAVLYCLSPHVIGWANLGRYLSQVQFFTLLTMYFSYEAFRQSKVRNGMVWASAASMSAMYLSWEGAGMFGIGVALAVLVLRRYDLRPLFSTPAVYFAGACVVLVVAGQNAHRVLQQTQRLWYGEGISDLALKPMWRYPFFDIDFYLINSSWIRDAFLPMLAFAVACFLAIGHRWRQPLRFALICLTTNALLMAALLPLRTNRYAYHLLPILVLIAAAAAVASAGAIWRLAKDARISVPYRIYVRSVAIGLVLLLIGLASGRIVRTTKLEDFRVAAYDVRELRYPHWDGPTQYLRDHVQEGDVVIATFPHTQNFLVAEAAGNGQQPWKVDYWLESTLLLQATIGDTHEIPLDRRSGSHMIYDLEQLQELFASHKRVWYCTNRFGQGRINDSVVSKFMRENMDVMFEDFATAVMLRDNNHRTAPLLLEEEAAGQTASDFYLR